MDSPTVENEDCYDGDESSDLSDGSNGVEDEQQASTGCLAIGGASESNETGHDVGPYSEEPIAHEEWLEEYNQERAEENRRELQNRLNGVVAVGTWFVQYMFVFGEFCNKESFPSSKQGKVQYMLSCFRCKCGHCRIRHLQNAKECHCCRELEECTTCLASEVVLREVATPPPCITLHPGFNVVCLNRWSLRSSAAKYKTIDGRRYRQTGSEDQ